MNNFIKILENRNFLHQCTDIDTLRNLQFPITAYVGFDCTAPSLHVGSLISIMMLRWLEKNGGTPIILLGGGTTKIGDPSGKDSQRRILSHKEIEVNKNSIKKVFLKFLNAPIIIDNSDWLDSINYINFLRDFGAFFSIKKMISLESVKLRLEREQQLTFLEFNYMLLQAYDYYHIYQKYNCILQMGGSDQWGNIISGIDLIHKKLGKKVFGLTAPLLTTSSGKKMGKTENGAIWLDEKMLDPYDYWQFWRNTEDQKVFEYLKLFTELPEQEIKNLTKLQGQDINEAKIILADEATKLCHGLEKANIVKNTAEEVFYRKKSSDDLPTYTINKSDLEDDTLLYKLMVKLKIQSSNTSSKNLIKGKGVKINDITVSDMSYVIRKQSFINEKLKISIGKKKHYLIKLI